jgi:hypothetical protein
MVMDEGLEAKLDRLRDSQVVADEGERVSVDLRALCDVLVAGHEAAAALSPFASIQADDGDSFDGYPDQVVIRCEVTAGEIRRARQVVRP